MNARTLVWVGISSALACGARAQTAQEGELAFRHTPGSSSAELTRVAGELRVIAGAESVPIEIDMAALQTREVLEVLPSGEAVATIRPDATTVRVTMPGMQIFSHQDRNGVTTLVNDVEQSPAGPAPQPVRLRISRNGRTTLESGGGSDLAGQLLTTIMKLNLLLPERRAVTGERWTDSAQVAWPAIDRGGATFTLPPLSLTSESEVRSVQQDGGRLVATIVTTTGGSAEDGSARHKATISTRFDAAAGEFIDAEGTVSLDMQLPDLDAKVTGGNPARLAGDIQFRTSVLTPDTKAASSVDAPAQTLAATQAQKTSMPSDPAPAKKETASGGDPPLIDGAVHLNAAGLELKATGGHLFVETMKAGSALAKAGLRQGDEIGGINGKSVDKMTEAEIQAAFQAGEVQLVIWRNNGREMFGGPFRLK